MQRNVSEIHDKRNHETGEYSKQTSGAAEEYEEYTNGLSSGSKLIIPPSF